MKSKKFYSDGVRFSCTECGACCSHPDGVVDLNQQEAENIAQELQISTESLQQEFLDVDPDTGRLSIKSRENGDCIFLQNNHCRVYRARPLQCRTFPFWPDVMKSEYRWRITAEYCPGMNIGREYEKPEIDQKLRQMRQYLQDLKNEPGKNQS